MPVFDPYRGLVLCGLHKYETVACDRVVRLKRSLRRPPEPVPAERRPVPVRDRLRRRGLRLEQDLERERILADRCAKIATTTGRSFKAVATEMGLR